MSVILGIKMMGDAYRVPKVYIYIKKRNHIHTFIEQIFSPFSFWKRQEISATQGTAYALTATAVPWVVNAAVPQVHVALVIIIAWKDTMDSLSEKAAALTVRNAGSKKTRPLPLVPSLLFFSNNIIKRADIFFSHQSIIGRSERNH